MSQQLSSKPFYIEKIEGRRIPDPLIKDCFAVFACRHKFCREVCPVYQDDRDESHTSYGFHATLLAISQGMGELSDVREQVTNCLECGACELRCPNTLFAGDFYGASTTTVGINGTGAGYTGALNSLGLVPQGVSGWSVTGGSPSISVSLAGSVTYTSTSALSGESLTLADSADGATVSMVYAAATQLITGTVVQTSTGGVVATFSVSATGTGTVTYGNGASGQIVNWAVQS